MASSESQEVYASQSPCDHAEAKLKEIIDNLFELGITVQDFQAESGSVVQSRINNLVTKLTQLDELKDAIDDTVPLDVFSCIEEGKNPDLLTRDIVDQTAAENQFTRGKMETMQKFQTLLLNKLGQILPEEAEAYRSIHPPKNHPSS
ncbi:RNA polymerase II mediator complex subunit [Dimargaris verticillata]|uniref:Mediator of RNA polymerase II transcription subunit 10 n=1 Tax=Dimargaris verticillata TaxID=2761393 RepID=A0A9W8AX58_9FUNG|nr:RNA polymerase II mediator complex subunit [Dimargaris verticillata]